MSDEKLNVLAVNIEVRTRQMEKQLARIEGQTRGVFKKIEKESRKSLTSMEKAMTSAGNRAAGFGKTLTAALAFAGGARGIQSLVDSSTRITNALKVAGLEGENLNKVYGQLFHSAQRNAAPLETLVTLYGRAAMVQKELGASQGDLLNFTDKVALALRVAGTDAQAASGALLQLSQALGSGVVRAQEFNSILEGALPIAQAAAAGLKEAGGSVSKLRNLVVDGKVSSEAFFRAFEAGSVILEEKVAGAEMTVSQHLVRLRNVLIDAAGDFDKGSGAAEEFGKMLSAVSDYIATTDFTKMGEEIAKYIGWVNNARIAVMSWLEAHGKATGEAVGADAIGEWIAQTRVGRTLGVRSGREMTRRFDGEPADSTGDLTSEMVEQWGQSRYPQGGTTTTTEKTGRLPAAPAKPKTVSLSDYTLPGSDKKSGSAKKRADDYERLSKRIADTTAALVAETEAQRGLNPLINDYGYAAEKARIEQELLTAAKDAGKQVTPELRAEIAALADQYAAATVEAQMLAESQEKLRETAEEWRGFSKSMLSSFISDLREGKSATEALANALNKVADKLLDIAMNSLFSGKGGGDFHATVFTWEF